MPDGSGGGGEGAGGGTSGGVGGSNAGGGTSGGFGMGGLGNTSPSNGYSSGVGSTIGSVAGGLLGSVAAGPVGALFGKALGGYLGGGGTFGGSTTGGGMGDSTSGFGGGGGGDISSALNIAGGINALTSGGGGSSTPGDPFGQYRAGLAAQYAGALQPGGATNIEAMPGYTQFQTGVMQPAMQASQRTAAGAGQLYSGGESAALQKIGQQGYSGFMNNYLNRLSTGSGASANPLGGAELAARLQSQQQQSMMQGIGAIGQGISGIKNLFGGGSNYTDMLSSNTLMSSTPNYLDAAGQLPTPDMSNFTPDLQWYN